MELTPEEKMGIRPKEFELDGKGAIEIVCLYNYECVIVKEWVCAVIDSACLHKQVCGQCDS